MIHLAIEEKLSNEEKAALYKIGASGGKKPEEVLREFLTKELAEQDYEAVATSQPKEESK